MVLDLSTIARLATPTVAAEFPFLVVKPKVKRGSGCGSCPGNTVNDTRVSDILTAVVGLSPTRAARLKQLLGVESITVYRLVGGKVVKTVL